MGRNERRAVRKPAIKLPNLRKRMLKDKTHSKKAKTLRGGPGKRQMGLRLPRSSNGASDCPASTFPVTVLVLFQNQIQKPASTNMRPWTSAVGQDFLMVAASLFQGVGQSWHSVVAAVVVNRLGQLDQMERQP
jgi:hypothetical protein